VGKIFGAFLAVLSMFIAPLIANAPDGLFGYLQEVNGCYSIPILTIIVVGYLTKFVPAIAAKIAIFSGVVLYSVSQFVLKPMVIESGATYPHLLRIDVYRQGQYRPLEKCLHRQCPGYCNSNLHLCLLCLKLVR
jgi:SSS family solute:Na+ symporter